MGEYEIVPIGWVESPLLERSAAPRQGDEGAPDAWLVLNADIAEGMRDLAVGIDVIVLTWMDRARRDTLIVRPRDDPHNPMRGVFSTRSPDRPNPIGLHTVRIVGIADRRIQVRNLEALNGTPIVDIKPVLEPLGQR